MTALVLYGSKRGLERFGEGVFNLAAGAVGVLMVIGMAAACGLEPKRLV